MASKCGVCKKRIKKTELVDIISVITGKIIGTIHKNCIGTIPQWDLYQYFPELQKIMLTRKGTDKLIEYIKEMRVYEKIHRERTNREDKQANAEPYGSKQS